MLYGVTFRGAHGLNLTNWFANQFKFNDFQFKFKLIDSIQCAPFYCTVLCRPARYCFVRRGGSLFSLRSGGFFVFSEVVVCELHLLGLEPRTLRLQV